MNLPLRGRNGDNYENFFPFSSKVNVHLFISRTLRALEHLKFWTLAKYTIYELLLYPAFPIPQGKQMFASEQVCEYWLPLPVAEWVIV